MFNGRVMRGVRTHGCALASDLAAERSAYETPAQSRVTRLNPPE